MRQTAGKGCIGRQRVCYICLEAFHIHRRDKQLIIDCYQFRAFLLLAFRAGHSCFSCGFFPIS